MNRGHGRRTAEEEPLQPASNGTVRKPPPRIEEVALFRNDQDPPPRIEKRELLIL